MRRRLPTRIPTLRGLFIGTGGQGVRQLDGGHLVGLDRQHGVIRNYVNTIFLRTAIDHFSESQSSLFPPFFLSVTFTQSLLRSVGYAGLI